MVRARPSACLLVVVLAAACVDRLPNQDLRILTAQPSAKLSALDLWKDFEADAAAAKARYFGKAIDVSDKPTAIEADAAKGQYVFFAQADERGVRAFLLDDRAAVIAKEAAVGTRITLRCFCEGRNDGKDLVLRSCITP